MIERILKNKNSLSEILFCLNFTGRKTSLGYKKTKAIIIVLFLAFGFSFAFANNVKASGCEGFNLEDTTKQGDKYTGIFSDGKSLCTCYDRNNANKCYGLKTDSESECTSLKDKLVNGSKIYSICHFKGDTAASATSNGGSSSNPQATSVTQALTGSTLKELADNEFTKAIKWILIKVYELVGWLFAIAATLFAWVVDPANISGNNGMLNKQAVKDVWITVRDLLNMTFILVLLFSAFCTIFQVDSWSLNKVWFNILLNALLVNFSYPIARFIIDISNVAFYYFLNNLFIPNGGTIVSGSSIFAGFGNASNLGALLSPPDYAQHDIAYIIAMIVLVFILGMTLMIVAGLFIVRLVALTMLVMFSPIGFVGYIFPSTRKYAGQWWDNLVNYSFFAPIMIFVMAIALRIMEAMKNENYNSFLANATANTTDVNQANFIAGAAFYVIPIIIMWTGIGIAKKFGIEGAGMVTGKVTKWGKWLANRPNWAWKKTGVPGGVKKGYENATKSGQLFGSKKLGWILKDGREGRENKVSGFIDNNMAGVRSTIEKKKLEDFNEKVGKKKEEFTGMGISELRENLKKSATEKDAITQAAQYRHFISDPTRRDELRAAIEKDPNYSSQINSAKPGRERDAVIRKLMTGEMSEFRQNNQDAQSLYTKGKPADRRPQDMNTGNTESTQKSQDEISSTSNQASNRKRPNGRRSSGYQPGGGNRPRR